MEQLGRAARRAGREVARLDQRDRQAAGGRVERGAGAGDAAADDDDVERVRRPGAARRPRGRPRPVGTRPRPSGSRALSTNATLLQWPTVVAAIDQGTTSTRCILFDHDARIVAVEQVEHAQILPRRGWVEHDPIEIWTNTRRVLAGALGARRADGARRRRDRHHQPARDDRRVGPRDRRAGRHRRSSGRTPARRRSATSSAAGRRRRPLPRAHRAAAGHLLRRAEGALDPRQRRRRACAGRGGELAFGTIDTLAALEPHRRRDGGVHVTDATNASRTLLMDLDTLEWVPEIADEMGIPLAMLPRDPLVVRGVRRRSRERGRWPACRSPASSATSRRRRSGRPASSPARPRTPTAPATSCCSTPAPRRCSASNGLLTTVCYALPDSRPVYALEGSIAVTGSLVQWLRDNLGLIGRRAEIEALAAHRRRQRRRLLRAGVLRPVRAVLAPRRARRASSG